MSQTSSPRPWSHPLRIADLPNKKPTRFDITLPAPVLAQIATSLGVRVIKKLRLKGELSPKGRYDWVLSGELGATVVQDCVITLEPVTSRMDEVFTRNYMRELPDEESGSETEMPDDETIELLSEVIDLGDVLTESLALFMPLYPRADGASVETTVFAEPGLEPMSNEDARPFAGLKSLRDALEDDTK